MDVGNDKIEIICPCGKSFESVLDSDSGEYTCEECGRIIVLPGGANGSAKKEGEKKGKTTIHTVNPVMDIKVGDWIGPYKATENIGEGGMGRVYRGEDVSLQRDVALKVLSHQLQNKKDFVIRFEREARAIAKLNHPNIVQIYYTGVHKGLPYYAMEFIPGGSLDSMKSNKKLNPEEAADLMLQAAEGLYAASLEGVIHRDIKPSNLMISSSGRLKIADFGLAKTLAIDSAITHTGTIIGTPYYMSPEQGEGRQIDERADIYSLGASFYHIMAGAPPFDADSPIGVILKHIKEDPKPLEFMNPDIPDSLARVIEKMMAKSPDDRYSGYSELIDDLKLLKEEGDQTPGERKKKSATRFLKLFEKRKGDKKHSYIIRERGSLHNIEEVILERCGFIRRFFAFFTDYAILSALYIFYQSNSASNEIPAAFKTIFLALSFLFFFLGDAQGGCTPGKILCRCRVGRKDGENLGYKRSFLRTFFFFPILMAAGFTGAELEPFFTTYYVAATGVFDLLKIEGVSGNLANICFIWLSLDLIFILVTPKRTAFHDLIAGACFFVVSKPTKRAVTPSVTAASRVRPVDQIKKPEAAISTHGAEVNPAPFSVASKNAVEPESTKSASEKSETLSHKQTSDGQKAAPETEPETETETETAESSNKQEIELPQSTQIIREVVLDTRNRQPMVLRILLRITVLEKRLLQFQMKLSSLADQISDVRLRVVSSKAMTAHTMDIQSAECKTNEDLLSWR